MSSHYLVDVLSDTWCIDPGKDVAAVTPRTKAIVAVHLYGNLCDMNALLALGAKYGIPVVEDAAEAIGSVWHGERAGSMGTFGAFSFHGSKTVTTGEGGAFVTRDPVLQEKVLPLNNHGRARGQARQCWPERVGFKYKMSNLRAAIDCAQLKRIEELVGGKRRVFQYYAKRLANLPAGMNPEPTGTVNGFWMPTIVVDEGVLCDRDALLKAFSAKNIDGRVFFWPLSKLSMFEAKPENSVSYGLYGRAVNLPTYHDLTEAEMDYVIDTTRQFLGLTT